jgi:hypothetical protein
MEIRQTDEQTRFWGKHADVRFKRSVSAQGRDDFHEPQNGQRDTGRETMPLTKSSSGVLKAATQHMNVPPATR